MVEIIDGAIQVDPHMINGISQETSNGFDKYWSSWNDITPMVEIANQHLIQNTNYPIKSKSRQNYHNSNLSGSNLRSINQASPILSTALDPS